MSFRPTQTGPCKFGWVWSSLKASGKSPPKSFKNYTMKISDTSLRSTLFCKKSLVPWMERRTLSLQGEGLFHLVYLSGSLQRYHPRRSFATHSKSACKSVRKTREGCNCRFRKHPARKVCTRPRPVWTQCFRQVCPKNLFGLFLTSEGS